MPAQRAPQATRSARSTPNGAPWCSSSTLAEQHPRLLQRDADAPEHRHADRYPGADEHAGGRAVEAQLLRAAESFDARSLVHELALGIDVDLGHEVLIGHRSHQHVAEQ